MFNSFILKRLVVTFVIKNKLFGIKHYINMMLVETVYQIQRWFYYSLRPWQQNVVNCGWLFPADTRGISTEIIYCSKPWHTYWIFKTVHKRRGRALTKLYLLAVPSSRQAVWALSMKRLTNCSQHKTVAYYTNWYLQTFSHTLFLFVTM